jgi:hypothetical protein
MTIYLSLTFTYRMNSEFLPKHQRYRQMDLSQSELNLQRQNEILKKELEAIKRQKE